MMFNQLVMISLILTHLQMIRILVMILKHNQRPNMVSIVIIREYGSTLYVGMAPKKNGRPYNSIATNELKSLLIYTDMFKYTHTF